MEDTIQSIYSCLEHPDNWRQVLAAISGELDSTHAFLAAKTDQGSSPFAFFEFGFEENYFAKYQQHFYQVDLWTQGLTYNPLGQFHASHVVCDDKAFLTSEIYQDFTRPADIRHSIGCLTPETPSGTTLELAFMSDHKRPHYSQQQVQSANQYLPHILHALSMSERLSHSKEQSVHARSALDGLVSAIILCDADGKTLYWNHAANELLEHSLLLSKESDKKLTFHKKRYQDELRQQMHNSISSAGAKPSQFYAESLNVHYRVAVKHWLYKRMTPWGDAESPALMILIDPCAINEDLPKEAIQQHFALTTTEAEITRRLCSGQAAQDIAKQRNVSPNTINQQIKAILSKTQTRNQTDLVSLVLRTLLTQ